MNKIVVIFLNIFIVTLILGQLSRLPLPGADGALLLQDFVLIPLVVSWLGWRILVKKSLSLSLLDFTLLLFSITTGISLIFALSWTELNEWLIGLFYWLRLSAYLLLFKITADLTKEENYQPLKLLVPAGFTFAVLGLLQFFLFPDFSKYVQHGWDPHYYRVLSTFFDPNYAGLLLSFAFLVALHQLYQKKNTLTTLVGVMTLGLTTVLTFSRSTYLALAMAMGVFGWLNDRRIILAMLILGSLVIATVPRVRDRVVGAITVDETAQLRLVSYEKTWQIIQDHPFLGVGFNTFRYAQADYGYFRDQRGVPTESGHAGAGADNSFLFIWATGGLLSLSLLLLWLIMLAARMVKSPHAALQLASLTALIVHAQFVNSLFFTALLSWFLILNAHLLYAKNDVA